MPGSPVVVIEEFFNRRRTKLFCNGKDGRNGSTNGHQAKESIKRANNWRFRAKTLAAMGAYSPAPVVTQKIPMIESDRSDMQRKRHKRGRQSLPWFLNTLV